MKPNPKHLLILAVLLWGTHAASGQKHTLAYGEYMNNVKQSNIDYLAEKYNVNIAEANARAARIFPDPELSLAATDNQERRLKLGYSFEAALGYSLELGGKRRARINLANSEKELTDALLDDFFRNLQADAALGYLNALRQKELLAVFTSSYEQMRQLARADSIRFRSGQITAVDAMQSKLEANMMWNEVVQHQTDYKNALADLVRLQGDKTFREVDSVTGRLVYPKRLYNLPELVAQAEDNRADLQAALKSKQLSERNLRLVKANRAIDLGLNVGVIRNTEALNEIAPAPAFTAVGAGVSIPLRFSNFNRGEIHAARYAILQSEANYDAAELLIRTEVTQAYRNYRAASRQVEQYDTTLQEDAATILKSITYSYQRGETSLLEVLNARRTYNEVYQGYCETLFQSMASLVELQRACGIWDFEL